MLELNIQLYFQLELKNEFHANELNEEELILCICGINHTTKTRILIKFCLIEHWRFKFLARVDLVEKKGVLKKNKT